MRWFLAIGSLILYFDVFGQGVSSNWHFGLGCDMKFVSESLSFDSNSAMSSFEGVCTVSDSLGNLQFYSNSEKIWNSMHQVMPNGDSLFGSQSSAQSPVAIRIHNSNKFYLFHTEAGETYPNSRLSYSIVDMSLDGGLGDVDTANKNVVLEPIIRERIAACPGRGSYEGDFWLAAQTTGNTIAIYRVSESGVFLHAYQSIGTSGIFITSQMKFSPNTKFVVYSARYVDENSVNVFGIQLLRFNSSTGVFSDPVFLENTFSYGYEFSSNNEFIYWKKGENVIRARIAYYEEAAILESFDTIGISASLSQSALQIGPDTNIYGTHVNSNYLFRISSVNSSEPVFEDSAVYLGFCTVMVGLPNFSNSIFPSFENLGLCIADTFQFFPDRMCDSVIWNFGDPGSGSQNITTGYPSYHLFSDTGHFTVICSLYYEYAWHVVKQQIFVLGNPSIELVDDFRICEGDSIELSVEEGYDYYWSTGDTIRNITVTTKGIYYVTAQNACSSDMDSASVQVDSVLVFELHDDTAICEFDTLTVEAAFADRARELHWFNGDTSSSQIDIGSWMSFDSDSMIIWLQLENVCGIFHDSFKLEFLPRPIASIGEDTAHCGQPPLLINRNIQNEVFFLWPDGSDLPWFLVDSSSTLILQASNVCGLATDTINVAFQDEIESTIGDDTLICPGQKTILNASWPGAIYSWSSIDGFISNDSTIEYIGQPNTQVKFEVIVTLGPCVKVLEKWVRTADSDCETICKYSIPNVFTPNGDGINDAMKIDNVCSFLDTEIEIFNRWGQLVYASDRIPCSWDGSTNGVLNPEGAYYIMVTQQTGANFKTLKSELTLLR